jgi:hypothetical protein
MDSTMLAVPVLAGAILIALGVIPGLFPRIADGVRDACESVVYGVPRSSRLDDRYRQPAWLAALGALLIVAGVLAYISV